VNKARGRAVVKPWALLFVAAVGLATAARAATPPEARGLIIEVADHLVYLDLGQRDGIGEGELFDIVSTEVLTDPVSGDTLMVTPATIGVVRVRQVFEKLSVAEVLQLQPGQNPLLLRVAPIQDAERLVQLAAMAAVTPGRAGPGAIASLVPGLHQYRSGQRAKGIAMASAEGGLLLAATAFRWSSNDWHRRYQDYAGADEAYLVHLGEGMQSRRRWSNSLYWLSAGVYAFNFIQVRWGEPAEPGQPATGTELGLRLDGQGSPSLCLVRSF
jgi:hypothetical protein